MRSLPNLIITGVNNGVGTALVLRSDGGIREFLSIPGGEVYGIAEHGEARYVAVRGNHPRIIRVNSSFVADKVVHLPNADPHCLYIENRTVHLVSSSEDTIHKFDLDLNPIGADVFGVGGDKRFHVNDVTRIGSKLFVSMFTDKADGNWDENAANGLVKTDAQVNPASMTWAISGLLKPHSPTLFKDELWVCDSGRGAVWCNSSKVFQEQGKWTRGLCVDGDFIHVGVADFSHQSASKITTVTKSGDIVRETLVPLDTAYGIKLL